MDKKNSLIFSVTYENYINNVLNDKENKTLGQWKITPEMVEQLKYAYVYLTNSNQMIVKKYEIEFLNMEMKKKAITIMRINTVLYLKIVRMFSLNIHTHQYKGVITEIMMKWMRYQKLKRVKLTVA